MTVRILHCSTSAQNYQTCIEERVAGFTNRGPNSGDMIYLVVKVDKVMKSTFWTPSDNQSKASLHISGQEELIYYLFDLVKQINEGIDSYEEDGDELVVEYKSMKEATEVLNRLREKLDELHPFWVLTNNPIFAEPQRVELHPRIRGV